jgi:hypothetical protein
MFRSASLRWESLRYHMLEALHPFDGNEYVKMFIREVFS